MSSWDVARLTVRLGDHNIHTSTETQHVERRVKRLVRHRGFDMRTLVSPLVLFIKLFPNHFLSISVQRYSHTNA